MGVDNTVSPAQKIGETAGVVWRYLHEEGAVSLTTLIRELDEPRDLVMQALGWLAREDKIAIQVEKRKQTIALKSS